MPTIREMAETPAYLEAFNNANKGPVFMGPFDSAPIEGWYKDIEEHGEASPHFGKIFRP